MAEGRDRRQWPHTASIRTAFGAPWIDYDDLIAETDDDPDDMTSDDPAADWDRMAKLLEGAEVV